MSHSEIVDWGGRVKLDWVDNHQELPSVALITTVHSLCFKNGDVMLVDLNHRGLDIPGGHREPGESAEDCVLRETMEEGYVSGKCSLIGMVRVDNSDNPNWRSDGRYPKIGFQVYYRIDITEVLPFAAEYESGRRLFVRPDHVPTLHHRWNKMLDCALRGALELPATN